LSVGAIVSIAVIACIIVGGVLTAIFLRNQKAGDDEKRQNVDEEVLDIVVDYMKAVKNQNPPQEN